MESFGRYQLHEQLGQGGMGVVYRAHDTVLERIVALKLVAVSYVDDPEMRERFFREARAAAHLTHKNIVTVYDLGEHDGRPYLAMEYLAGEDLQRRLARPEKMPLSRRLEVALEICDGVEHAHAHGIIHRDLKPANIYLAENGAIKILDFGLARPVASQLTHSNMLMGTINYMAPEQVRAERADQRSDIFSLGVVLYELFGGRKAFEGDSVASTLYKILEDVPEPLPHLDSELPAALWNVVERALAKSREDRYQQVSALRGDLQDIAHPASVSVVPSSASWPAAAPTIALDASVRPPSTPAPSIHPPPIAAAPPSVASTPSAPGPSRTGMLAAAAVVIITAIGGTWYVAHRNVAPAAEPPQAAEATSSIPPSTSSVPASAASPAAPEPTPAPAAAPAATDARPRAGEADRTAAARQAAETARGRMTEGRAAAEAAGARSRASAAFRDAERRAQDAEREFKAQKYEAAAAHYYEASGLFRGAESAARSAAPPAPPQAPAEPAPQRLPQQSATPPGTSVALPPPVAPPANPPAAPAAPAAQPSSPAGTPSRTSPPAAAGPTDEERVGDLVNRYRDALEARSLDRLKQIWPSLAGASETAIRQEFQHASRIAVEISPPQIAISGSTGRVTFVRNYSLSTVDGQHLQSSSRVTMDVRRAGAAWVIQSVTFSPR